ncbi:MAG: hypothetical protein GY804_11385 [Alphaproteobacteria bacterium]|nr:hypothetical protein [Alphaproteobacteria bacterium]
MKEKEIRTKIKYGLEFLIGIVKKRFAESEGMKDENIIILFKNELIGVTLMIVGLLIILL